MVWIVQYAWTGVWFVVNPRGVFTEKRKNNAEMNRPVLRSVVIGWRLLT